MFSSRNNCGTRLRLRKGSFRLAPLRLAGIPRHNVVVRRTTPAAEPAFVAPMAARLVKELPDSDEWLYEVKLDGYRALMLKDGEDLRILSRKKNDLTRSYPTLVAAGKRVNASRAVIDGEIVALDAKGRPSFQALQHRSDHAGHQIVFFAFDLVHLDGIDLKSLSLEKRRAKLPKLLQASGLRMSVELPGSAADVLAAVRTQGLEGVVGKRRSSSYQPGERSGDWVKVKLDRKQEFVVGGYRPDGATFDALLVGYYENEQLRFSGKVRAGFVRHTRRELLGQLRTLHVEACPFVNLPDSKSSRWSGGVTAQEMREMQWVRPQLVAQIRFLEFTAEGRLRHAAFVGFRADKHASNVRREP